MDNTRKENILLSALVFCTRVFSCVYCIQSDPYINITVVLFDYFRNITLSQEDFTGFYLDLCNTSTQKAQVKNTPSVSLPTEQFPANTDISIYSKVYFCGISINDNNVFVCSKQIMTCNSEVKIFSLNIDNCQSVCICDLENQNISIEYFSTVSLPTKDHCEIQNTTNQTQSVYTISSTIYSTHESSNTTLTTTTFLYPTSESETSSFTTVLYNNTTVTDLHSPPNANNNNEKLYIIIGCSVGGGVLIILILFIVLVLLRKKLHKTTRNSYPNSNINHDSIEINASRNDTTECAAKKIKRAISDSIHNDTYNTADVYTKIRPQKSNVEKKIFTSTEFNPYVDTTYSYVDKINDTDNNNEETQVTNKGNNGVGYFNESSGDQTTSVYSRLGDSARDFQNVYNISPVSYADSIGKPKSDSLSKTHVQLENDNYHLKDSLPKGNPHSYENVVEVENSQDVYAQVNKHGENGNNENKTISVNISQV